MCYIYFVNVIFYNHRLKNIKYYVFSETSISQFNISQNKTMSVFKNISLRKSINYIGKTKVIDLIGIIIFLIFLET